MLQLLHGCTSQSLRTSDDKQLTAAPGPQLPSPPSVFSSLPSCSVLSSISVYLGGGMFLYTAFVATEKPKEEDEAR